MPDFQTFAFKIIQVCAGIHAVTVNAPEAIPVTAAPSAGTFRFRLRCKTNVLAFSPPAHRQVQAALFGFGHGSCSNLLNSTRSNTRSPVINAIA